MSPLIFPSIIIGLSLASAIGYLVKGDAAHALYWLSGAILNAAITFPLPRLPWSH